MATDFETFIPQDSPTPSPSPSLDPTIKRAQDAQTNAQKEKDAQTKAQNKKDIRSKKYSNWLNDFITASPDSPYADKFGDPNGGNHYFKTTDGKYNIDFKTVIDILQNSYKGIKNGDYYYFDGHGMGGALHHDKQTAIEDFNYYKKVFLDNVKSWEKKNKVSVLDVLTYGNNQKASYINKDVLFQVLNDNPDKKQKFITPQIYVPGVVIPDKGAFRNKIIPKDNAVDPSTDKPPGTTTTGPSSTGVWGFQTTTDSQGNTIHYYTPNNGTINIALIGGSNGKYIAHDPSYGRAYDAAGNPVPQTGFASDSPQTMDEATQSFIKNLESTPDGVKNFKQLLISKNIIPPNAVNGVMVDPTIVDGTTFNSIQSLLSMVTGHNVVLADKGGKNAPLWSVNDFLKNMTPLSNTTTNTQITHQKINPNDYEMSIDQMFQSVLGRGATKDELAHFSNQLQQYSNANPSKSTTTTTQGANGNSSTVNQSGGVSSEAATSMMRDQALHTQGAEDYTKGAKYFGWLQQAINNPISLGG
jgi:hypothetical protein